MLQQSDMRSTARRTTRWQDALTAFALAFGSMYLSTTISSLHRMPFGVVCGTLHALQLSASKFSCLMCPSLCSRL
jgi:hypothetical protein